MSYPPPMGFGGPGASGPGGYPPGGPPAGLPGGGSTPYPYPPGPGGGGYQQVGPGASLPYGPPSQGGGGGGIGFNLGGGGGNLATGGPAPYPPPVPTGGGHAPYPGTGPAPYPPSASGGAYPSSGGPAPYPGTGPAPYYPGTGPAPYYPGSSGGPAPYGHASSYPSTGPTPYQAPGPAPYQAPGPAPYQAPGPAPYQAPGPAPYSTPVSQGPGYGVVPHTSANPPSSTGGYSISPPPVPSSHTHSASVEGVTKKMGRATVKEQAPPTDGTVKPYPRFNAEEDARALRTAMKGIGTDEKAIITVLAYRSNKQRQDIKKKFKSLYGKDLHSELKGELSGHFEEVVLGLLMTPAEYDAYQLREALQGVGTTESVLIDILCTRSSKEMSEIKRQYKTDYGRSLERDVTSDTSGHFKRLLVSMLTGNRDTESPADRMKARSDAQALYEAGEARWGTDESKFNVILASRSFPQLRAIFEAYSKICKYDIEQSISREMSGDLKHGMLAIVKVVRDKSAYFAERLYKSMKGLGTDDRTLVSVMVSRCEVDMVQIKRVFQNNYGKSLGSFIKGDTSGDYKRILLALARED